MKLRRAVVGLVLCVGTLGVLRADASPVGYVVIPISAERTDVLDAYAQLHSLGLRVGTTKPMTDLSTLRVPLVSALDPRAGTRVRVGSTVWVTPGPGPTASPTGHKSNPGYRVPTLLGETAESALSWVSHKNLLWAIPNLPAVPPSRAPQLLDNYRVTAQSPRPGSTLHEGFLRRRIYHLTPLTLTVELAPGGRGKR